MAHETPEERTPVLAETECPRHDLAWALTNDEGLRPGWAVALFGVLLYVIMVVLDMVAVTVMPSLAGSQQGPRTMVVAEAVMVAAMAVAAMVLARAQQRRARDYHWLGPRAGRRFAEGLASGFVALSALVALLATGGWLRFVHTAVDGKQALKFGVVWAAAFLLTALFEEGTFRCSLLGALERGLRFEWALATVVGICAVAALRSHGHGALGVAVAAVAGLVPCAWLARRGESGFWQAAWVTSVGFGAVHTGNGGETAVGIFAASLIGFVFVVSVRVTGSAWWAIGCHTAWDWAETFFYGTADSGFAARGHLLTTAPAGSAMWSGGAAGPEGSVLVTPVALALAVALCAVYGRKRER